MHTPVAEADSRPQVLAVQSTELEYSIVKVRSKCMSVAVWEHTYMTYLFFRATEPQYPSISILCYAHSRAAFCGKKKCNSMRISQKVVNIAGLDLT